MGAERENDVESKKKLSGATERPFTTGLFLLRCLQVGLRVSDLDDIDAGMVLDLLIEQENDTQEWDVLATQEDFDRF